MNLIRPIILILLFVFSSASLAQTKLIDGWYVEYQGSTYSGSTTKFSYRACPSSNSTLRVFTIGLPSCFPAITMTSNEPVWAPAEIGRNNSNGVFGAVFSSLNLTTCQTFNITLPGQVPTDTVMVGVTANTPNDCQTCGQGGTLPGPKCITTSGGFCGKSSRGDIAIIVEQSDLVKNTSLQSIKQSVKDFLTNTRNHSLETPRVAIGSVNYSTLTGCLSTNNPFGEIYKNARLTSLTSAYGGMDYDGFLQFDYGNPSSLEDPYFVPNSYRAVDGIIKSCGSNPLDAAFSIVDEHLNNSPWEDPQAEDTMILITSGIANRRWGYGTCANPCDCEVARFSAQQTRDALVQAGTRVVTIALTDEANGCSSTDRSNARQWLRQSIASDPSLAYESTSASVSSAIAEILARLSKDVSCEPAACGVSCQPRVNLPGGSCVVQTCQTPTPSPLPTLTPTPKVTMTPLSTPTPNPTTGASGTCIAYDNTSSLLSIDQTAHSLERGVRSATKLLREAAKKASKKNRASLLREAQTIEKQSKNSTFLVWRTNWTGIPGRVLSCPVNANLCRLESFSVSVTNMTTAAVEFTLLTERALSRAARVSGIRDRKNRISSIRRSQKSKYDEFVKLTKQLSPLDSVCRG